MAKQKNMKPIEHFPPNVPPALIQKYREVVDEYGEKAGSGQRKLAARLGINVKFVNDLLVYGVEPTRNTKKGREAREKLFLPNDKPLTNTWEVIEALQGLKGNIDKMIKRLENE